MIYQNIVEQITNSIGGSDNIVTIKRTRNELIVIVFNDEEVDLEKLRNLHRRIKGVELSGDRLIFTMQKRDVSGLFEGFKTLPGASVKKIKDTYQEEEQNQSDVPFMVRLKNTAMGDLLPLVIAMVGAGYLVGIVNFVGHMLG